MAYISANVGPIGISRSTPRIQLSQFFPPGSPLSFVFSTFDYCKRMFRQNEVLLERYQVDRMINEGHFCAIYSGQDLRTNSLVAIKKPKFFGETDLEREFHLLRRLDPFTFSPTPLDYGRTAETEFYVMSVEGKSLGELAQNFTTGFNEKTVTLILYHLLLAIQAIHDLGVSHSDVTLLNVCVPSSPEKGRLILVDYGNSGDLTATSRRRDVSNILMIAGLVSYKHFLLAECRRAYDEDHRTSTEDIIDLIESQSNFDPSEKFQWDEEE